MRHASPGRKTADAPSPLPRLLAGLILCAALLLPAATPASACRLDWASVSPLVEWTANAAGPFPFQMTTSGGAPCPGLTVTIAISQGSTLGNFSRTPFGSNSHREDCQNMLDCPVNIFGSSHDLAVVFDPDAGGASPVTITATFSLPFPDLKFEISDIDFGGAPGIDPTGHRLDRITVAANGGGVLPTSITPKNLTGPYTFVTPIVGNTVTAKCTGTEATNCTIAADTTQAPLDNGSVVVDFTGQTVTTVTITYSEAGNDANPAGRGIGVLANLTPVELMSFEIE